MNSQKIYTYYYKTPVGELILGDFNNKLCLADWRYRKMRNAIDKRISDGLNAQFEEHYGYRIQGSYFIATQHRRCGD